MSQSPVHICVASTPEGEKHYVTLLPPDLVFSKGLIPEAIVGVLLRPLSEGEPITSDLFARNSVFVQFMHQVIARHAPDQPDCQDEARRLGTGWIFIIDRRTKTPQGPVPPEDIIGALKVHGGTVVPDSYQASSNHLILSPDGFFRLTPGLHQALLHELQSRMATR